MEQFKVAVRCITYNHSRYIEEAMNGFCMQQTDFPFVCVIVDDASTDGEQDVIRDYLQTNFDHDENGNMQTEETDDYVSLFARHKKNTNCFIEVFFLKNNHYQAGKSKQIYFDKAAEDVKYVAICEGDDYWIDPLKLQKQVDFMECHPNCSLCQHSAQMLYPDGNIKINRRFSESIEICPPSEIIKGGAGITCSTMLRKEILSIWPEWRKVAPVGDIPQVLVALKEGEIGYIDEVMSCYRVSAAGSWTQRVAANYKKNLEHYRKMIEMYDGYNEWSGRKYEPYIKKKARELKIRRLKFILLHYKNMLLGK